jgi:hypothetical protein
MTETVDKINNYLQHGGMFNPELMEHHKVADLLLECRRELEHLTKTSLLLTSIIQKLTPDKYPDVLFISGHLGPKDQNGLPEKLLVTPAYGCDWAQIYVKSDRTTGPEW